ncbi:MAG TPA: amidohydrolase family protein [Candidatus Acidoferrales bacterium]|jgi:predicted TIM-barrel fold metal-dependent hydrolase|nr:amidohydrolase family protein [Candidatus Acidoferrales bacterium]
MLITDAQVHLWEIDRPDRPWPGKPQRPPHRLNGFSAEQMLAEMEAARVDRAVVVPPTWVGENNATALEAAARYPERFAVVGRFDVKAPDARQQLEGWLKQPHMLGIRMSFHVQPFVDWLNDGSLDWFWAACERLGIPLMALVPGKARKLLPVAERHPGLTLLIPHMACPLDTHVPEAFSVLDDLLALSRFPKVYVMVSSAPNFSNECYPFRDLHPHIHRIYDAFGPHRMLWGADRSRLTSSYRECVDLFRESLDFLSVEDKEWIMGKALAEALNWPEASASKPTSRRP